MDTGQLVSFIGAAWAGACRDRSRAGVFASGRRLHPPRLLSRRVVGAFSGLSRRACGFRMHVFFLRNPLFGASKREIFSGLAGRTVTDLEIVSVTCRLHRLRGREAK